jgi:hypothetical protein
MDSSCLIPLFWQHHESEAVLREEIARMDEAGIRAFIVEARPHPRYLQAEWWEDLRAVIGEAARRGMKVYIFDDGAFPSGFAGGAIAERFPQHCKRYLAQRRIDAAGPLAGSSFLVGDFVGPGEELVAVVCGRLADRADGLGGVDRLDGLGGLGGLDGLDVESLEVLTGLVRDGVLYWDVPEGRWRVFVLAKTRDGGEEHTRQYLNPLSREAARCYIDIVHEEHYRQLKPFFGNAVAGFFTDEPRFGSAAGYDVCLGRPDAVIPWADDLLAELDAHPLGLGPFARLLPCLWYPSAASPDARYAYMDVVSRRFGERFLGQLGDWCRAHGVALIGHVVEENGAHARLGYGAGHYFRAMEGLDMAGLDIVCNVFPGQRDGRYATEFFCCDADFSHWGLAKMASSCAQLDPLKKGRAFCEAFGAYGWSEGLKAMKWITDAVCARGGNVIAPHAFSPREYPDPDCPPHFYARGNNPQWPLFSVWSGYASRVCGMLSGGEHIAPVAVLYHAEAEWGGGHEPFEKAVKALMRDQIDSTVVSADHMLYGGARNARMACGGASVEAGDASIDAGGAHMEISGASMACGGASMDAGGASMAYGNASTDAGDTRMDAGNASRVYGDTSRETGGAHAEADAAHMICGAARMEAGRLTVCGKTFGALVIPYSQYLPPLLAKKLRELAQAGCAIAFTNGFPERCYGGAPFASDGMDCAPTASLPAYLRERGIGDISVSPSTDALAYCRYRKDGEERFFLVNEDVCRPIRATVSFPLVGPAHFYDALADRRYRAPSREAGGRSEIDLELEPYQSLFVVFAQAEDAAEARPSPADYPAARELENRWALSLAAYDAPGSFVPDGEVPLENIAAPHRHPRFSGTMRYEQSFRWEGEGPALLDLGRVGEAAIAWLNGAELGRLICPPYRLEIPAGRLAKGENRLRIDVINTLAKANHANRFDRHWPQEPSGLLGPVILRTAEQSGIKNGGNGAMAR